MQSVGIAMLGLGRWGRHLGTVISRVDALELVTCYARTPESRQTFANEFGCQDASSLEAALTAPGVRAAIITAPAHTHHELTHACAQHGIHVFVEKPMALKIDDGQQMIRDCEEAGLVLMVNHEMRCLGSSRAMKRNIEDGDLGRAVTATASFCLTGTFKPNNWRCHRDTNRGGALMQLGIHHIDTLRYLLGPVVGVRGFFTHVSAPVDIDDVGMAHLTFESGAMAIVTSSYVSPKTYELHIYGDKANVDCVVDMRVWPDVLKVDSHSSLTVQTRDTREITLYKPQDALVSQLDEFALSVRGKAKPETNGAEGLAALAVVEAAMRSFETGAPVDPQTLL